VNRLFLRRQEQLVVVNYTKDTVTRFIFQLQTNNLFSAKEKLEIVKECGEAAAAACLPRPPAAGEGQNSFELYSEYTAANIPNCQRT